MLKVVVDTGVWIRALCGGRYALPVLETWKQGRFEVVVSEALLHELSEVWQRPRLRARIVASDALDLLELLRYRSTLVEIKTIPPRCRDTKDEPVLATAIDGRADAIVTTDSDLRADDELRAAMVGYGVEILGVTRLLEVLSRT